MRASKPIPAMLKNGRPADHPGVDRAGAAVEALPQARLRRRAAWPSAPASPLPDPAGTSPSAVADPSSADAGFVERAVAAPHDHEHPRRHARRAAASSRACPARLVRSIAAVRPRRSSSRATSRSRRPATAESAPAPETGLMIAGDIFGTWNLAIVAVAPWLCGGIDEEPGCASHGDGPVRRRPRRRVVSLLDGRITDAERKRRRCGYFDQAASNRRARVLDLRGAQQAYVAAGQGDEFWIAKVSLSLSTLRESLAALRLRAAVRGRTGGVGRRHRARCRTSSRWTAGPATTLATDRSCSPRT